MKIVILWIVPKINLFEEKKSEGLHNILVESEITKEQFLYINANIDKLPGIYIEEDIKRVYPYEKRLSHILGFIGEVSKEDLEDSDYENGDIIGKSGLEEKSPGRKANQICAFLWIYTGYPASSYEGISVEVVRENCGRFLAKNDHAQGDLVAGVPDSGVGHAIGYAMESGLPYRRPLTKYTPYYGRSYTPPSQEIRDLVAAMKLIPV